MRDDVHMMAVVAGCRNGLVGTGWVNSCLNCTNVIGGCYSHLVGASLYMLKVISNGKM